MSARRVLHTTPFWDTDNGWKVVRSGQLMKWGKCTESSTCGLAGAGVIRLPRWIQKTAETMNRDNRIDTAHTCNT